MIRIYSFTTGPAVFLEYQRATFRKFLSEEFDLIVVNDGQNLASALEIEHAAHSLGLRCERPGLPPEGDPSVGLGRAMEFAVRELARDDDDISFLVHADIFACGSFSARELLDHADVVAHPECKSSADGTKAVCYPWSGVIGLRMPSLDLPETMSFGPGLVEGIRCDTGGGFARYLQERPGLRLRALDKVHIGAATGGGELLPEAAPALLESSVVEVAGGVFLHYFSGSGWRREQRSIRLTKQEAFFALLDRLLSGEATLSRFQGLSVGRWPEPAR